MRMGNQMLDRLAAAAAVALGCRTAFRPDLMSSLNIQIDTPRNCSTSQDLSALHQTCFMLSAGPGSLACRYLAGVS